MTAGEPPPGEDEHLDLLGAAYRALARCTTVEERTEVAEARRRYVDRHEAKVVEKP